MPILLIAFFLGSTACLLRAQTGTNASAASTLPPPTTVAALSFLTPAQQDQYAQAHAKALEDNPGLKAEGEQILRAGQTAKTPAEQQAFIEKMNSHRQKLRAAMLKVDPTLQPVFAEIDKHISQLKVQQVNQAQAPAPGGSNSH